mmetsp:Transcript_16524/g.46117  ORF Transcript_16524/g.46117 Transcript_16524/m.46117 type:complete len:231 (-) Transcript_16524:1835-2527(-)
MRPSIAVPPACMTSSPSSMHRASSLPPLLLLLVLPPPSCGSEAAPVPGCMVFPEGLVPLRRTWLHTKLCCSLELHCRQRRGASKNTRLATGDNAEPCEPPPPSRHSFTTTGISHSLSIVQTIASNASAAITTPQLFCPANSWARLSLLMAGGGAGTAAPDTAAAEAWRVPGGEGEVLESSGRVEGGDGVPRRVPISIFSKVGMRGYGWGTSRKRNTGSLGQGCSPAKLRV